MDILTEDHLRSFRENGYVAVGPVVDDATLRGAFEELESKWAAPGLKNSPTAV